jgi:hypothetical protein
MKIPRLLQAVLILLGIYLAFRLVFDVILGQVIPASVLTMYMFFATVGVLMVFTFTEDRTRALLAPIKALVEDPSRKLWRNIVFVLVPLLAGWGAHEKALPSSEAPIGARVQHSAPPSTMKAYGKTFDLIKLVNPLRKVEKEDPAKFKKLVAEGAKVYIQNCQYCHGDKLDGKGPYARGFNPLPINFQDVGTIAQLQESFLFWRIATGGPGLPKDATPWLSSMPVWQNFLTEDEIWKAILFLYDYTGQRPRSFEHG